jgi:non-specific serine/threonine protein kinase
MHVGKTSAAAPLVDKLLKIDPLNPINHSLPGWLYFFNGQFESALEPFQRMLQMVPENPAGRGLYAVALIYNGRLEEAFSLIDRIVQDEPKHLFAQLGLFLKYAVQGKKQDALQSVTDELRFVAGRDITYSWFVAMGYAILDEREKAMDWLEKTVDLGFINYPLLSKYDPFLEKIRREERFKKLMEKVKSEWEKFVV